MSGQCAGVSAVEAPASGWREFSICMAVIVAALLLYWPSTQALIVLWTGDSATTYTHGFLIAAMSCWLLWRVRAQLAADASRSSPAWLNALLLAGLLGVVLAWQFAYRAGIQIGYLLLLPPLLWGVIFAALGRGAARAAAFPIAFLYFAIPIWDYANPLAQWGTVYAVRGLLELTGIPVYFQGNLVQIPAGIFEIESGCSGLHFIIVAISVAALLGELRQDGWRGRVRWILLALALAVITNWIRVYIIVLAGHLTHMQHYIVKTSHYGFGWGLFAITLVILLLIERRTPLSGAQPRTTAPQAGAAIAGSRAWLPAAAAAAILVLPLLFNAAIESRLRDSEASALGASQPRDVAGWRYVDSSGDDWKPVQTAADYEQRWNFVRDQQAVSLYFAWYREQLNRKKLGGFSNRPAGEARILAQSSAEIGGERFALLRVEQGGSQSLLLLQYRVGERSFSSATRAQFWYSWQALRTLSSPLSSVRVLRAACQPDCDAARQSLNEFVMQTGGGS